jgi:hypothetical protein
VEEKENLVDEALSKLLRIVKTEVSRVARDDKALFIALVPAPA